MDLLIRIAASTYLLTYLTKGFITRLLVDVSSTYSYMLLNLYKKKKKKKKKGEGMKAGMGGFLVSSTVEGYL